MIQDRASDVIEATTTRIQTVSPSIGLQTYIFDYYNQSMVSLFGQQVVVEVQSLWSLHWRKLSTEQQTGCCTFGLYGELAELMIYSNSCKKD